jgi:hypothetical protein
MADDTPEISGSSSANDPMDATRKPRTPPTIDVEASRIPRTDAEAELSSKSARDDGAGGESSTESSEPAHRSPFGVALVASVGVVVALLIGGAAWFAGLFDGTPSAPDPTTAAIEALDARLNRLENTAKPATDEPNARLVTRLDAIEKSVTASLAVSHDEIAAVRTKADRTASSLDDIKASSQSATPSSQQGASQQGSSQGAGATPDLADVESRLAQLDAKIQALSAENAQLKTSQTAVAAASAVPNDDSRLKRAIAANALDVAVRQGEPFSHLLTAAKQWSDNSADLKPLERFATNGVPSAAVLSRDLLAVLPQLEIKSDHALQSDGWLDRLRINAARLVKIRRMDTTETSTSGVIERIAASIRRQDVMEVKRELNTLPPLERAKAQPWIDQVDAREAALAASREFSSQAMTTLAKPAP